MIRFPAYTGIEDQLKYTSCTIVLIGSKTADREWVLYEIERSWELGKGLVGIHIHNLKDENQRQSYKGENPFKKIFTLGEYKTQLSNIIQSYDPPHSDSYSVYSDIENRIVNLVEEAISIRSYH